MVCDYYGLFGVSKNVSDVDIKCVYCKLVCELYFDVNLDEVV